MTTQRRFTADFKAWVALDGLRGDRTIQEIAAMHKVHSNLRRMGDLVPTAGEVRFPTITD